MSTTTISDGPEGPDGGGPGGIRRRIAAARARRTSGPGLDMLGAGPRRGPLPRLTSEALATLPAADRRVVAQARRHGVDVAKQKAFDAWTLHQALEIPYFHELAKQRDHERQRLLAAARTLDQDVAVEAERLRGALAEAQTRRDQAQSELDVAEERRAMTALRLDQVAARAERWARFRDSLRTAFQARQLERQRRLERRMEAVIGAVEDGLDPDDGPGPGWERLDADDDGLPGPVGAGRTPDPTAGGGVPHGFRSGIWEGERPHAGVSHWTRRTMLVLLTLVELPIYYSIFKYFHGSGSHGSDSLTYSLTFGVAVVMIALPHLAGLMLRERHATGSSQGAGLVAAALLGLWGGACYYLGNLRSKALLSLKPTPIGNLPGQSTPTLASRFDLSPHTMTVTFMVLLLMSGGLAVLLGLGGEHPYLAAYRHTRERIARLHHGLQRHEAGIAEATEAVDAAQARHALREEALVARLNELNALYEHAAHAYLDGIVTTAKDAALTQAAMFLGKTYPLLPPPAS